jgi:hypothetical protein
MPKTDLQSLWTSLSSRLSRKLGNYIGMGYFCTSNASEELLSVEEGYEAERASSSWLRAFAPFCGTHEEFLCQFFSVYQISSFVLM